MTLSINDTNPNDLQLCLILSVAFSIVMVSVVWVKTVTVSFIMFSVVTLGVIMLIAILHRVVSMLGAIMLTCCAER